MGDDELKPPIFVQGRGVTLRHFFPKELESMTQGDAPTLDSD